MNSKAWIGALVAGLTAVLAYLSQYVSGNPPLF